MIRNWGIFIIVGLVACYFFVYKTINPDEVSAKNIAPSVHWEQVNSDTKRMEGVFRAKVPGGWLVIANKYDDFSGDYAGLTFVPDPSYKWE